MDLDFLGHPRLAEEFASRYAKVAGDGELVELLPFYECYRAVVRGKVESLRSREEEVEPREREAAHERARRYFRIAARFATGARSAELIVVCGLSGSGKSTAARTLGDLTGFPVVSSDVVRKDLAGLPRFTRPDAKAMETLYGAELTRRTYGALATHADELLGSGSGVVLDATFRDAAHRRTVTALGAAHGVPVMFVECRAPQERVRARLRARTHDVSDADERTYFAQRAEGTTFVVESPARRLLLDTSGEPATVADELDRLFAKA
jgi:predicted kinase